MGSVLRKIVVVMCFISATLKSQPIHEYFFNGNFNGTAGGPVLNEVLACGAGPGSFGMQTILSSLGVCAIANAFCFNDGGGVSYPNPSYITNNYSINMLCLFGNAGGRTRLIDFSNGMSNPGIYLQNNCVNVSPVGNIGPCPFPIASNQYHLYSFIRNGSTGLMNIYVDGVLFSSFVDTGNLYALSSNTVPVVFFKDDNVVPCETKAGCVKYVSVSSATMSAVQVLTTWLNFCPVILPVGTNNFSAIAFETEVLLKWKDDSGGISDFEIQRSDDAANFNTLGKVNVNAAGEFEFRDKYPLYGTNYYRLRKNLHSGGHSFSSVSSAEFSSKTQGEVYPNPADDRIYIGKQKLIAVKNVLGQEIRLKDYNEGFINTSDFPPGIFYLIFENSSTVIAVRH